MSITQVFFKPFRPEMICLVIAMIQCAIREWETGSKKTVFFEGSIVEGMFASQLAYYTPPCGIPPDRRHPTETYERSLNTWYQQSKPRRDWIVNKIQKKAITNSEGGEMSTVGRIAPIENKFNHCMDDLVDSDNEASNKEGPTLPQYPWRRPASQNIYSTPMPSSDDANPQDATDAAAALCGSETENPTAPDLPTFGTSSPVVDSPRRSHLDTEDLSPDDGQVAGTGVDRDNVCSSIHPGP